MRLTPLPPFCGAIALLFSLAAASTAFAAHEDQVYPAADYGSVSDASLPRAIHDIERSTGGRVLEVRLLHRAQRGFLAVVSKGHELINVRYGDLDHHTTVLAEQETPRWMLDWRLRQDMHDIRRATVAPADAVRKVEQATHAPATDIELARPLSGTNAVLAYDVEVVKDGHPERLAIDANTGQIIADPQSLFTPWTPERLARQDAANQPVSR